MKFEFPSGESFVLGLLCHNSSFYLLKAANRLQLVADEPRNGPRPAILYTTEALFYHPTVTNAIDAAIISIVREWIENERFFLKLGRPNKCAELEKLLSDFLKTHRAPRAKKPAKQPAP